MWYIYGAIASCIICLVFIIQHRLDPHNPQLYVKDAIYFTIYVVVWPVLLTALFVFFIEWLGGL